MTLQASNSAYEVGLIGNNYGLKELLPVLNLIENVKTFFVPPQNVDSDQLHKLRNSGVTTQTLSEIISNNNIQLIFSAVPPEAQYQLGKTILENNKNLYCEKPVGINSKQVTDLQLLSKLTNKNVYVGFQYRFDPGINMLKNLFDLNLLQMFSIIEVDWHTTGSASTTNKTNWRSDVRQGGGVHRDFLCHVLDYLRWITNDQCTNLLNGLVLDPSFNSNINKLNLVSSDINTQKIVIRISRGFSKKSYWVIFIVSESGSLKLKSEFPFNVGGFSIEYDGNKQFCDVIKNILMQYSFLQDRIDLGSARTHAIKTHFELIIQNEFNGGINPLPNLQNALFTQKISDRIQPLLFSLGH